MLINVGTEIKRFGEFLILISCVSIIFLIGEEHNKNMVRVQVKNPVLDTISIVMPVRDSVLMNIEVKSSRSRDQNWKYTFDCYQHDKGFLKL